MDVNQGAVTTPAVNPREGWEEDGIFIRAHKKVIEMIFDKCKNIDEENKLYELLFNRQVAKLKASKYEKQLYYEAAKIKAAKSRKAYGARVRPTTNVGEFDD